ncbi:MAG: putative ABC transport system ATP-binding protein [Planctomycetota bacterium]|jgi:putative ABC transport system ATP-binding protein
MEASIAVRVEGLVHRYANSEFELRLPQFTLKAGELVACIGASGSGKSTLLNLIAGVLVQGEGRIEFECRDWSELGEAARRATRIRQIGLVFQEFELLEHLSVRENVLLPYLLSSALKLDEQVERRAEELATAAGIAQFFNRRPRELSMGERQRVAICRALVTQPSLILADEPTGNLDPSNSRLILELLLAQVRGSKATLLMVTHNHALLELFDRVVDLDDQNESRR